MKNSRIAFGVALMSIVASQGYAGDGVQSGTIGLGRQLVGTIRPWLDYKIKKDKHDFYSGWRRSFYTAEKIGGANAKETYDGVAMAIEAACNLIREWMKGLQEGEARTWADVWTDQKNIELYAGDGSREQQNFAVLVLELATHIVQRLQLVGCEVVNEVWKKYLVPQQTKRKVWEKKKAKDGADDSYDTGKWVEVEVGEGEESTKSKWWIPESKKGAAGNHDPIRDAQMYIADCKLVQYIRHNINVIRSLIYKEKLTDRQGDREFPTTQTNSVISQNICTAARLAACCPEIVKLINEANEKTQDTDEPAAKRIRGAWLLVNQMAYAERGKTTKTGLGVQLVEDGCLNLPKRDEQLVMRTFLSPAGNMPITAMLVALIDGGARVSSAEDRARSKIIESAMGYRDNVVKALDANGNVAEREERQMIELQADISAGLPEVSLSRPSAQFNWKRLWPTKILSGMNELGLKSMMMRTGTVADELSEIPIAEVEEWVSLCNVKDWPNVNVTEAVNDQYIQAVGGDDAFRVTRYGIDGIHIANENRYATYADIKGILGAHRLVNLKLGDSPMINIARPPQAAGYVGMERTVSMPGAFMEIGDRWVPGKLETVDGGATFTFKKDGEDGEDGVVVVNDGNMNRLYRLVAVVCGEKKADVSAENPKQSWILSDSGNWTRNGLLYGIEDVNEVSNLGEAANQVALRGGSVLYRNFGADRKLRKVREREKDTGDEVKRKMGSLRVAPVGQKTA